MSSLSSLQIHELPLVRPVICQSSLCVGPQYATRLTNQMPQFEKIAQKQLLGIRLLAGRTWFSHIVLVFVSPLVSTHLLCWEANRKRYVVANSHPMGVVHNVVFGICEIVLVTSGAKTLLHECLDAILTDIAFVVFGG